MEAKPRRRPFALFLAGVLVVSLAPFPQAAYAELADSAAARESEEVVEAVPANTPDVIEPRGIDMRVQADATVTNFAELQAAITAITSDPDPQGTIIIENDFSFDTVIEINKACNITIKGGDHVLTAASSRHFQISSYADVEIEDAVLDGASTAGGINLINKGKLALERTTMQNCSAPSGRDGGAINTYGNTLADAVELTISDNCLFKDNLANTTNPHSGGAIALQRNTKFAMSDSSIEGSTARGSGGGMHILGGSVTQNVDATFTNVTFDDNESLDSQGGGIAIKDYATVVFDGCTFSNNKSTWGGGGLFSDRYCDITITDCEFLGNESSGSSLSSAGGIGLDLYDNPATSFTMTGTLIDGNRSRVGGGISLGVFADYQISDCTITNNIATQEGGGVQVSSAVGGTLPVSVTLTDCVVSNNAAANGGGLAGGQYKTFNSQIKLVGTTVSDNVATGDGGGVYMEDATLSTLHADANTVFSGNTAATLHDLTDPSLIATHATNILTDTRSTALVGYAYNNYDVNQVLGPQIVMSTVEYKPNGGEGTEFSETVLASATYNAKTVADLGFSKGTDEFLYWTTTADPEDPAAAIYRAGEAVTLSSDGSTVTLYAQWKTPAPATVLSIARLFGDDRFKTSGAVSSYGRDLSTEPVLIVASGADRNFPDALAASSLSGANGNAPILLTDPATLPAATRAALAQATSATKVYVLGDAYAVSDSVKAEIESAVSSAQVVRLGGDTRQETAEVIFGELGGSASKTAILARSMNFPDSLSASSWAAFTTSPIFLTGFDERSITQGTLDALASGGFERIVVLGDEWSVPESVAAQARDAAGLADADVIRLGGDDRIETSLLFAEWATDAARGAEALSWDNVALTRDDRHPDALSGGALQGKHGSVVVLTPSSEAHAGVLAAITAEGANISEIRFFGDEHSVAHATMRAYVKAIPFDDYAWMPDDSVAFDID